VTYFDGTVQGIEVGSPVKFRGVTIGRVKEIEFLFTELPKLAGDGQDNYVAMVMEIDKELFPGMFEQDDLSELIQRSVDRGMRVRIEPQGLTGLNYIEINYLDPARFPALPVTWTPRYYYIPSAPGEITSMLDSVNNMMREIEKLNIGGISDGTVKLLENLNTAVTGAEIDKFSQEAQKLFAEMSQAVKDADVSKLSQNSQQLIIEISKSNEELQRILGNVEPATRLNGDDIAATLANLKIITDNLRTVSAELSQNPSSLIFSRPPKPASVLEDPKPPRRRP
jgi:ABC-type transporter Mla subunit MlaD